MNLEKELGHKLFHRLGRRAVLTEAGTIFLDRAQRILFEVESATKEMSDSPALERRITVGAIPTLAPFLLPSLIVRCKKRYPNLQINVQEDFKQNLLRAVLEGEIDLAIVALPIEESRVHVESLLKEPLLLAMGKNHPLAARTAVASADLADQNFVLLGTSSSLTAQVKSFCGDHNFDPKISFRCSQVATVKALLSLGTSVSILPQVVRGPEDEGTLTYVKLSDAEPFREIGVIRHMQRYQSRGAEQFLTLLREWARELAGA